MSEKCGLSKLKLVTKREGKHTWMALKDEKNMYHCWFDPDHIISKSIIFAGDLYNPDQVKRIKEIMKRKQ